MKNIARDLKGKIPVIYSSDTFDSVALRTRQQIEENAKQLCSHHTIPEMNHNELVGWKFPENLLPHIRVILFDGGEHENFRNTLRFNILGQILGPLGVPVFSISGSGSSLLSRLLYMLHLGDILSVELAKANAVDPTPVEVINFLKDQLNAVPY
jgi:glucose/mannose-6-phosphate isomerase